MTTHDPEAHHGHGVSGQQNNMSSPKERARARRAVAKERRASRCMIAPQTAGRFAGSGTILASAADSSVVVFMFASYASGLTRHMPAMVQGSPKTRLVFQPRATKGLEKIGRRGSPQPLRQRWSLREAYGFAGSSTCSAEHKGRHPWLRSCKRGQRAL